jgi:hypothetical protein
VLNATAATNLTSRAVTGLSAGTGYQARVRYQDGGGAFSGYSAIRTFTTDVTGGGGAGTILFQSNWSAATGTSSNAITDGGAWNQRLCSMFTSVANVIGGSSVGWNLTPNVLQITRAGTNCTQVEREPVPGLSQGQDYYIRIYIRNDATAPDGQNASNHPVCINCLGQIQAVPWSNKTGGGVPAGKYDPMLSWGNVVGGSNSDKYWIPQNSLDNGRWYRFEYHVDFVNVRASDADVRIWPRVYDMSGNLLYDARTFRRTGGWGGSTTQSLQAWYDAGGLLYFNTLGLTDEFGVGYEGPGGATDTGQKWYYAGVAVGRGGWLGGL